MNPEIDFSRLPALASRLRLSFQPGRISLEGQRMVLLHAGALGALRKELVDSLGLDRTRGVLTRMGYASGRRDARMVRELLPGAADDDIMILGPQLHTLEGIVNVTPVHFHIDVAKGEYHGQFIWENSHEAELHLEQFGLHHEAVCWNQLGYASGYTSEVMGRSVLYREIKCRGKGDPHCLIVGKLEEDWGAEIESERRYYKPDHIADQIVQLQKQVEQLRSTLGAQTSLHELVGASPSFRHTVEMVRKAGENCVTTLLLGETGVGKEMFARALHRMSPRASGPFIAVNCSAMPEELIESELFGVEKGAFTGALHSRPGRFERAHGGTLFLDEVGELSTAAQAKLLRVLQEGELERVGDTRSRRVDVWLLAATNVDLQQAVQDGRFRADLYYRLNVYPVVVPPLRERREDIPLLVQRFLDTYNTKYSKRIAGVTEEAMKALTAYDWPGNIRELENMIERGVIIVPNDQQIDVKDLFPATSIAAASCPPAAEADDAESEADEVVEMILARETSLEELEARLLESAVRRAKGNLSRAARLLGLTRPQLAYRLSKRRSSAD